MTLLVHSRIAELVLLPNALPTFASLHVTWMSPRRRTVASSSTRDLSHPPTNPRWDADDVVRFRCGEALAIYGTKVNAAAAASLLLTLAKDPGQPAGPNYRGPVSYSLTLDPPVFCVCSACPSA